MDQEGLQAGTARAVRFGVYEVDLEAGELRRRGIKVNLQEQPFQVLALLITNPGQLLTREELQKQIWVEDTLVDADLGLNTAIKKIRTALGDSAENPRFIETLTKRGYRFIAPLQVIQPDDKGVLQVVPGSLPERATKNIEAPDSVDDTAQTGTPNLSSTERTSPETGNPRRKYQYFGASILLLAVALGFLAQQIGKKNFHLFSGRGLTKRGVFVYRETNGPNGSIAKGIGGYDLRSGSDQAFAFDFDHSGKLDHLVLYRPGTGKISIVGNSDGTFTRSYDSNGIGGYDLKSPHDRVFAFDYDHSGKLDHLVLYRSGTDMLWILKNDGLGIFTPVYRHSESGTTDRKAFHDPLPVTDQVFAFDYDHSGKLDHLAIYRPGVGTLSILKNIDGVFIPVSVSIAPGNGMATHDLPSAANQAFAFDYDHSGKMDHLVIYKPGTGNIVILKNTGGTFSPVYKGSGIGGYDLKSPNDRVFAFDYDHNGKLDNLLLYRPGAGLMTILKNANGTFNPVYEGSGIGGYDLKSWHDQAFAFDYEHSGKLDHIVLYRPGQGSVSITYLPHHK